MSPLFEASHEYRIVGLRPKEVLILVVLALIGGGLVTVDRLWLDPGGRGFSGEANDKCAKHGGVKEMNAQQGYVICWDGTAR